MTINRVNLISLLQYAIDRKAKEEAKIDPVAVPHFKSSERAAWEEYLKQAERDDVVYIAD